MMQDIMKKVCTDYPFEMIGMLGGQMSDAFCAMYSKAYDRVGESEDSLRASTIAVKIREIGRQFEDIQPKLMEIIELIKDSPSEQDYWLPSGAPDFNGAMLRAAVDSLVSAKPKNPTEHQINTYRNKSSL